MWEPQVSIKLEEVMDVDPIANAKKEVEMTTDLNSDKPPVKRRKRQSKQPLQITRKIPTSTTVKIRKMQSKLEPRKWEKRPVVIKTLEGEFSVKLWSSDQETKIADMKIEPVSKIVAAPEKFELSLMEPEKLVEIAEPGLTEMIGKNNIFRKTQLLLNFPVFYSVPSRWLQ